MRALVLDNSRLTLQTDFAEAVAPQGATRVRVTQAGICETDLQLIAGYMGFSGVLGHEFVGIAESGPAAGKRVVGEINCICNACDYCNRGLGNHCPHRTVIGILNHDGAFADSLIVPDENLHEVPDSLTDDMATLVEPLAAALQIPEQVEVKSGMRAVVVGDGRLGNLCAQVLKELGCDTIVLGKHAEKLTEFARLGIETVTLDESDSLSRSADLVVDCAGTTSGLSTALSVVRPRGTLVMKTTVGTDHQLPLASIVIDEVTVVGSRCGPFGQAIDWLVQERLDLDRFITATYPLEEFSAAFDRAKEKDARKVILKL